jgi:nucleoredoxin
MRTAGKKIEIVFVSSDKDEASFKEYFDMMSWLTLPFQERALEETLKNKYGVEGINDIVI